MVSHIFDILGSPNITTLERLLAIAVSAYTAFVERPISTILTSPVSMLHLQAQVKLLAVDAGLPSCGTDPLAWSCLVLKATFEDHSDTWEWAHARLSELKVTAGRLTELEKAFLPLSRLPVEKSLGESS